MCSSSEPVLGYGELVRDGIGRYEIASALASGHLIRIRRGVYAVGDACDDVVAAAAHGGTIGCISAARHRGLWTLPTGPTHVWVGRHGHTYDHVGCACTEHWSAGNPGRRFRAPSVVESLVQVYHCAGVEAFFAALESAMHQRQISSADLRRLGARLDPVARDLIEFASSGSESGLESLFRLRIRRRNLSIVAQAHVPGVGRVDFLIDGWLIIELDGRLGHELEQDRIKDLLRDVSAAHWRFRTLRFSSVMLLDDWPYVESTILRTLGH